MKLFSHLIFARSCFSFASSRFIRLFVVITLLVMGAPSHGETSSKSVEFSQAELDQILAPIALYPDTVLSQVLIAATYPIEVVQADRWARLNTSAKGADAVKLVEKKDWDPSVKALVAFPDILQRMSDDVDWTQKLGDAFLSDEGRVMDSIQKLRKKAYTSGSLDKVQHLKVQRDADVIVIEPAEERVVYVPVYDTRVVYGNWWWPDYPPVYWHYPSSYTYVSGFYWGSSIYIGPSYYYSSCHWSNRHVVVVEHYDHHYPRPSFYTSRSIIGFEGAREWRHEPTHRRGVAYYNNQLRDDYGSRHESYRDARTYREQHRNNTNEPRHATSPRQQNRFDEMHPSRGNPAPRANGISLGAPAGTVGSNRQPIDRTERLRERMNRSAEQNNTPAKPTGFIDRTISPGGDYAHDSDNNHSGESGVNSRINERGVDNNRNVNRYHDRTEDRAIDRTTSPPIPTEQNSMRDNRENATNNTGSNTDNNPARINNRFQRDINTTPHNEVPIDRTFNRPDVTDSNSRIMRVDDTEARRNEIIRTEQPRQEIRQEPRQDPRVESRQEQRTEQRPEPQQERDRGNSDDSHNRFRRAM